MKIKKLRRPSFIVIAILAALAPSSGSAESPLNRNLDFLVSRTFDVYEPGPRIQFSVGSRYASIDGTARAREKAVEEFYPSSKMGNLSLGDNMGISAMTFYDADLDLRLGRRNHFAVRYLFGMAEGNGRINSATGFNDSDYFAPGETESKLTFDSLQLEWYFRTLDFRGDGGRYQADLGAGAMNLRTYLSFAGEGGDLETEAICAPLVPYLLGRFEWTPRSRVGVGADFQYSLPAIKSTGLTELPGDGHYFNAGLYARYPLNDYLTMVGGVNYQEMEIAFYGIETNHLNHHADNELEATMTGAYIGVTMDDPQTAVLNALRRMFR